jgi:hypothetical protein
MQDTVLLLRSPRGQTRRTRRGQVRPGEPAPVALADSYLRGRALYRFQKLLYRVTLPCFKMQTVQPRTWPAVQNSLPSLEENQCRFNLYTAYLPTTCYRERAIQAATIPLDWHLGAGDASSRSRQMTPLSAGHPPHSHPNHPSHKLITTRLHGGRCLHRRLCCSPLCDVLCHLVAVLHALAQGHARHVVAAQDHVVPASLLQRVPAECMNTCVRSCATALPTPAAVRRCTT